MKVGKILGGGGGGVAWLHYLIRPCIVVNNFIIKRRDLSVVMEKGRQYEIIYDVHCGVGESEHSKAMASHLGQHSTYE